MKWKIKRILLKVAISILSLTLLTVAAKSLYNPQPAIKIYKAHEQISNMEATYIISEEAIMSKLQSKSQIVSLEQQLDKKDTYVDENWAGKRVTELSVHGTYKLGLETKDIEVRHIDNKSGMVFIKLPPPTLISLKLPYDQIHFEKQKGFLRASMDEKEEKQFYKTVESNIVKELMKDKELMKHANMFNQAVVKQVLFLDTNIKAVVFE